MQGFFLPAESFRHCVAVYPGLADFQSRPVAPLSVTLLVRQRYLPLLPALDKAVRDLQQDGVVDAVMRRYVAGDHTQQKAPAGPCCMRVTVLPELNFTL